MLKKSKARGQTLSAHCEQSHLDLQCLQIQLLLCLALYRLVFSSDFYDI